MRPNCFAAFNSWKTSKNRVFLPFLASTSLWPERLPRGPADNTQRLVSTATQLIRGTPGIPCDRSLVLRGEAAGRAEPPVLRSPPGPRGCPAPRAPRRTVVRREAHRPYPQSSVQKRPRDPQAAPQASRNPEG